MANNSKNPIASLRRSFSSSSQVQLGDHLMDQSRALLQATNVQLIELHDRGIIHLNYQKLRNAKEELDNYNGSQFQKLLQARNYRRMSNNTFKAVKAASDRAIDNLLMNRFEESMSLQEGGSGSGPGTFTDLDELMSTYRAEFTHGEGGISESLAQDRSVQHVIPTSPTQAVSCDRTDRGASQSIAPNVPVPLSLHRDGTMPRFDTTSIPDVSPYQRANEEGEISA